MASTVLDPGDTAKGKKKKAQKFPAFGLHSKWGRWRKKIINKMYITQYDNKDYGEK